MVQGSWASGIVARRAAHLANPPTVWEVSQRSVVPATAAAADLPSFVDRDAAAYVDVLRDHGAEPVVEHGRLVGQVLGLEVARVVDGRLEVGVGRHDRDARAATRRADDPGAELDQAVAAVRRWRRPGVVSHPANTLARSRWLRSIVCSEPGLVGAASLTPVAPPLPAADLTDNAAVPSVGVDPAGAAVVAVCSTGVDLDVVPTAADSRGLYLPEGRLLIVVPEGDDLPVTRGVAGWLDRPAEVRTVPRSWAELGPR